MGLAPLSALSVEAYHLIFAYLMPLPYETPNHLGVLLTRPFQDVLVLQVQRVGVC